MMTIDKFLVRAYDLELLYDDYDHWSENISIAALHSFDKMKQQHEQLKSF